MSNERELERRYRRLLACYPARFRQVHEQEMLTVLLACSPDGAARPSWGDTFNLLRSALRQWLSPRGPRAVPSMYWAVRLMIAAAVLELVTLVTVVVSRGAVDTSISHHLGASVAAQGRALLHRHVVSVEIAAPIVALVWLALAWANARGQGWARALVVALAGVELLSLLVSIGEHVAFYAPADLAAALAVTITALAAALLATSAASNRHYARRLGPGAALRA